MPTNKTPELVGYKNEHTGRVEQLPKTDFDDKNNILLESRQLQKAFRSEPDDTIAQGYRNRVEIVAEDHRRKAEEATDDVTKSAEAMRHLYALHCLATMKL